MPVAAAALLAIVAVRQMPWSRVRSWISWTPRPADDVDVHELVDDFRRLRAALDDAGAIDATHALDDAVWPAIGGLIR
jgi:hypothetical protein